MIQEKRGKEMENKNINKHSIITQAFTIIWKISNIKCKL